MIYHLLTPKHVSKGFLVLNSSIDPTHRQKKIPFNPTLQKGPICQN